MKYYLILFAVVLASCHSGQQIKIVRNDNSPSVIVFDGKDTVKLKNTVDSVVLGFGRHTFKWNGKAHAFDITDKGGILNPDQNEFVWLEIEYMHEGEAPEFDMTSAEIAMNNFIIIDSFLICEKRFEQEIATGAQRKTIIDSILTRKNGNYAPMSDLMGRKFFGDYDTNALLHGFKKIGKQNLFIEKSWDFDINRKIPDEIAMPGNKDGMKYRRETDKSCIIRAEEFLYFAQFSRTKYAVTDLRRMMRGNSK